MGLWNYYFIAKFYLYFVHYMGFHVGLNLIFALFLLFPLQQTWLKRSRTVCAFPAGVGLFYYDTWFPPFYRVLKQSRTIENFSTGYLLELFGRFIHWSVVLTVLLILVLSLVAARKLRISTFVLLTMLIGIPLYDLWQMRPAFENVLNQRTSHSTIMADSVLPIPEQANVAWVDNGVVSAHTTPLLHPADTDLDTALQGFYREQAAQSLSFQQAKVQDVSFDIIVLQVCSMSWDDLRLTGEDHNPLYSRFDYLFTSFNSAASYSGPAAIRLLRASCGQSPHANLYAQDRPGCHVFNQLGAMGFERQLLMNHDGSYGGFLNDIQQRGGLAISPEDSRQAAVALQAFDGTPIRSDYAVLSAWNARRQQQPAQRVALYYNTISLHDGNHYPGEPAFAGTGKTYPHRVHILLGDVSRFLDDLEHSGRKAVVVVLSEHGADMRGDKMQIPFMREIPSPQISIVPLGIRLVGIGAHRHSPLLISQPSSYMQLSRLLAEFIQDDPFTTANPNLQHYVENLGTTPFVAENEDIVILRYGSRYYIRYKNSGWTEYQQ